MKERERGEKLPSPPIPTTFRMISAIKFAGKEKNHLRMIDNNHRELNGE